MIRSENYLNYVLTQLSELDNVTLKKMFGGIVFFREDTLFAAITGGKFRLKAPAQCEPCPDETSAQFSPVLGANFCEVPAEILEDKYQLTVWAEKAVEAARKNPN